MKLLTVGLIVKDEDALVKGALESVKKIADEIIILDTGSHEMSKTKKICSDYGTVYDFEWVKDFSAARNALLEKSTSEWFMYIDADEIFELKCDIKGFLNHLGKVIDSSQPHVFNIPVYQKGGYLCSQRLFNKLLHPGLHFSGSVFETIENKGGDIIEMDISINNMSIHHRKDQQGKHIITERDLLFRQLLLKAVKEEVEKKYYYYFYLAKDAMRRKKLQAAEKYFSLSLEYLFLSQYVKTNKGKQFLLKLLQEFTAFMISFNHNKDRTTQLIDLLKKNFPSNWLGRELEKKYIAKAMSVENKEA